MKSLRILLVEDDPGDVRLTREAMKDSNLSYVLDVVHDGADALDFLYQRGNFIEALEPDIVLLDLNLPNISGYEVLKEVKSDQELRHIPMIVLSTSDSEKDILTSYRLCANSYIIKPDDFEDLLEKMRSIEQFWFDVAQLPKRGET